MKQQDPQEAPYAFHATATILQIWQYPSHVKIVLRRPHLMSISFYGLFVLQINKTQSPRHNKLPCAASRGATHLQSSLPAAILQALLHSLWLRSMQLFAHFSATALRLSTIFPTPEIHGLWCLIRLSNFSAVTTIKSYSAR